MKLDAKTFIGFAITIASLVWVFWGESPSEIWKHLTEADLFLLTVAVAISTLGIWIRAWRWKVLLAPVAPGVPFEPRLAATAIGFAANNVLPARVGEFARAFTLARLAQVPVGAAFGSLVMERLFDGLVIVGFLFATMAAPSFPAADTVAGIDPRAAARGMAIAAGIIGALLFFLAVAPLRSAAIAESLANRVLPQSFRRPIVDALHAFLGGLGVLRDPRLFALSLAWAIGQWGFLALSYHLAFRAFGIYEVPFLGAVFLQSIVALAASVPAAPGFFGLSEAVSKAGLALWGVEATRAVSYAIGFHIVAWFPITLLGFFYLWKLDLRWNDVKESEERVEAAVENDPNLPPPPLKSAEHRA